MQWVKSSHLCSFSWVQKRQLPSHRRKSNVSQFGFFLPYLSSRRTDILHVLNTADAIVRDFSASYSNVVPKTTRTFIAEPGDLTLNQNTRYVNIYEPPSLLIGDEYK